MPRRIRGPRSYCERRRHVLTPGGERDGSRVDLQTRDYLDPAVDGREPAENMTAGPGDRGTQGPTQLRMAFGGARGGGARTPAFFFARSPGPGCPPRGCGA